MRKKMEVKIVSRKKKKKNNDCEIIADKDLKEYLANTLLSFQTKNKIKFVATYRHAPTLERLVKIFENCNFAFEQEREEFYDDGHDESCVRISVEKIPASKS